MKKKLAGWSKEGNNFRYQPPMEVDEKKMQEYFKKNPTAPAPKVKSQPKMKTPAVPAPKNPVRPKAPRSPFDMRNRYFA